MLSAKKSSATKARNISGLKVKRYKNGEIKALTTPGRAPYGAQRGRWRRRLYFRCRHRCHALAHVYLMMDADERNADAVTIALSTQSVVFQNNYEPIAPAAPE